MNEKFVCHLSLFFSFVVCISTEIFFNYSRLGVIISNAGNYVTVKISFDHHDFHNLFSFSFSFPVYYSGY